MTYGNPDPIIFSFPFSGEPGLSRPGDHQPQHDRSQSAHVRRGPAPDLHAHAQRLLPEVRQLAHVQGPAQNVRGHSVRVVDHQRRQTQQQLLLRRR
jgi:hypothetical protein